MNITNPIAIQNIGDPYVLRHNGKYYMYATSHFNGFYCWVSKDLNSWSAPLPCYEATERSFGNSMFWAPEVYEFDGRFYMYYTAHWKLYQGEELRIGVAVADRPEGPFLDVWDQKPMFDFGYGVLDATVLQDNGKNYLYYSIAGANHFVDGNREAQICVVELGSDYASVVGEGKLLLRPEQNWELEQKENKQFWNEGPFIVKYNGQYHMMYSANFFASPYYAIGCAVADHPMGPFRKYLDNPVLRTSDTVSGPGHNSVVQTETGEYYCIYHAHTHYDKPSGDRQVYIVPMWFENDKICLRHPEKLNKT